MEFPLPPEGSIPLPSPQNAVPAPQEASFPPPPEGSVEMGSAPAFPPPPQGSTEIAAVPPPPPGSLPVDPTAPDVKTPDGFWSTVGNSFSKGFQSRVAADTGFAKLAGGLSLEKQYQDSVAHPEIKDEIDNLLGQQISQGWSSPKWWGAQIAHGTGGMIPGLAAGLGGGVAGGAIGGPIGGVVGSVGGFATEGGMGSLVPAYMAARAKGLDPDAATKQAIIDSGISAATAAAMGLAPELKVFGKVADPAVIDQVAMMTKRPVMEALTQLGIIQPTIAVTGHAATSASHGEVPGLDELATTFATGVGMGVVPVGAHAAVAGIHAAKAKPELQTPAGPDVVQKSFENQQPKTPTEGQPVSPPLPEGGIAETDPEAKIFYSPVLRAAREKLPASGSAEQVIATLRNTPGVKEEELMDLNLPGWLADQKGKINKDDLIAHIESNAVKLEEVIAAEPEMMRLAREVAEFENGPGSWNRIGGGGQQHYIDQARRDIMNQHRIVLQGLEEKYGYQTGKWPQEARDQLAAARAEAQRRTMGERAPEYGSQVMPGEHSNYREFILKVPERGPRIVEDNPMFDPWLTITDENQPERERIDPSKNFEPQHFESAGINQIAHIRTTDRTDRDGRRLLHVEEIQSDLHQQGRKAGYLGPGETRVDVDALERRMDEARQRFEADHRRLSQHDPALRRSRQALQEARQAFEAALGQRDKLPDLPFKTSWSELAVKRILRQAADEGYDGISWSTGDQVALRQNSIEQARGSREFYDKIVPQLFRKWAKKLGADTGTTQFDHGSPNGPVWAALDRIPPRAREMRETHYTNMGLMDKFNDRNGYMTMNPAAGTRVRMGLPLYETGPQTHRINDVVTIGLPKELAKPALKIGQIIRQFSRDMGISRSVRTIIEPSTRKERGYVDMDAQGRYVIHINTNRLRTGEDLYATAAHEFGHIIQHDKFAKASDSLKAQIYSDFDKVKDKYLKLMSSGGTVGDLRSIRDNAISQETGARNLRMADGSMQDQIPLSELTRGSSEYMRSFQEYFAEQVAKWATTSDKALSKVDKFFKALGTQIRKLIENFTGRKSRTEAEATPAMQKWLDSLIDQDASWYSDLKDELNLRTKQANQEAVDRDGTPEVAVPPLTASTGGGRDILANLPGNGGPGGPSMAAHADRMNKFYEWMTSLPQIAELNKHIRGLATYKEVVALMNIEKNNIMGAAKDTLDSWKRMGDPKQLFSLNKFIEDYANGMFKLTPDGLVRRPTQQEFAALAAKHKLSSQALGIFDKLVKDFDGFLEQYRDLLIADARRIKDPQRQAQAIVDANSRVDKLLQRPFFPLTRFGKYTITIYDTAGNIRHFEQTDSLRKQAKIKEVLEKSPDLLPGDRVRTGEVAKDATPLLGMPPGLLDALENKLNLSGSQRAMLDQLRFDYAPSQSFRHQFRSMDVTPGYSTDFQRAYAHFFFHGANHITRVKWVDALRDQIREVKRDSILLNDAVKRDKIANYMTQHLDMLVDPKPDFAALRGLMFHWFLGFNPASATLNLSQTAIMTHPHLASKFGDLRSLAAITRAGSDLNNFYKKSSIQELAKGAPGMPAPAKLRALAEAIKEGVISETQAHTLAAVSEDRNLLRAFGSKGEEFWQKFSQASSWMFEMTEQYNRRVAFRAAWELGMKDPNNRYVAETVRDNPLQYQRLRDQGWTHQEAAAFTAAKDSVEKTQFVYAPYSRPKMMWGRKGAIFIFKSFIQNTLFNLWANKPMAARSLLIMGVLGGMMGLPGMENVKDLLKNLAFKFFGKDFDIEDMARQFVVDVTGGKIGPDLLLHGTSKYGFGLPQVLDVMGQQVGIKHLPIPVLDRTSSISMGDILGFDPTAPLGPTKEPLKKEMQQLQRASGAGFGLGFAMYNFLTSQQSLSDMKRWEMIMPRVMANASKAGRWAMEGGERNQAGNQIVKFDVHDTEQMAEILARAAGYQPRRMSAEWERIGALAEQKAFWQIRQGILLRQFGEAVKENNPENKERVIAAVKQYNADLPPEARGYAISGTTLRNSVRQRMKVKAAQEAGYDTTKAGRVMEETLRKYFPDAAPPAGTVDARPVR